MKSEPATWSFQDQIEKKVTCWDGVRNYLARNHMRDMKLGDLCLFYHSVTDKQFVGIVKVVKTFYPDHTDSTGKFGMVDVEYHQTLKHPVDRATVMNEPALSHLAFVKQGRLSVSPVDKASWDFILNLSEGSNTKDNKSDRVVADDISIPTRKRAHEDAGRNKEKMLGSDKKSKKQ